MIREEKTIKAARIVLLVLLSLTSVLVFSSVAYAGTTVIHVETEEGGDIYDGDNNLVNQKGALFWNGTKWVTNDTAAHMYYTDLRTGERLKEYTTTEIEGTAEEEVYEDEDFVANRQLYTYDIAAAGGGYYTYEAVEYVIEQKSTGIRAVIRSRGTGDGVDNAFFDAYVEDGSGGVTALRGDPIWFFYPHMSLDEAFRQTSDTEGRKGEMPTQDANYFMDKDGGSDMGGLTYSFHTSGLNSDDISIENLGSSFIADFSLKRINSDNELIEVRFLPTLVSEEFKENIAPRISPDGGKFRSSVTVTISGSGDIYYTDDKSDPRTSRNAKEYSGPFKLRESATVRAASLGGDSLWSDVTSAKFNIYKISRKGRSSNTVEHSIQPPKPARLKIILTIDSNIAYINDVATALEAAPITINDRTMVPYRFLAEAFGAKVEWLETNGTVLVTLDGQELSLAIGQTGPGLDVPAQIVNDRTLVPLRYISEYFDAQVTWNESTRTIEITK